MTVGPRNLSLLQLSEPLAALNALVAQCRACAAECLLITAVPLAVALVVARTIIQPLNTFRESAHNYQRDGFMAFNGNGGNGPNYGPNSFEGTVQNDDYREPPIWLEGTMDRHNHRDGNDDYTQAGNLFRLLDEGAQQRLIQNIVDSMRDVPVEIQKRQIPHFMKADPAYGHGVAAGLGIDLGEAMVAG